MCKLVKFWGKIHSYFKFCISSMWKISGENCKTTLSIQCQLKISLKGACLLKGVDFQQKQKQLPWKLLGKRHIMPILITWDLSTACISWAHILIDIAKIYMVHQIFYWGAQNSVHKNSFAPVILPGKLLGIYFSI